jgi:hypothetical protein
MATDMPEMKVRVTDAQAEKIRLVINSNPDHYRNKQNQISANELVRRALDLYLSTVSDSSINQTAK